jgi:hypothetical protein
VNQPFSALRNIHTLPQARSIAGLQRSISHFEVADYGRQEQHPSTPMTIGWAYHEPVVPAGPVIIGWVEMETEQEAPAPPAMEMMNRAARRGKRANKGKRPVSRARRRTKKRSIGNHRR